MLRTRAPRWTALALCAALAACASTPPPDTRASEEEPQKEELPRKTPLPEAAARTAAAAAQRADVEEAFKKMLPSLARCRRAIPAAPAAAHSRGLLDGRVSLRARIERSAAVDWFEFVEEASSNRSQELRRCLSDTMVSFELPAAPEIPVTFTAVFEFSGEAVEVTLP